MEENMPEGPPCWGHHEWDKAYPANRTETYQQCTRLMCQAIKVNDVSKVPSN